MGKREKWGAGSLKKKTMEEGAWRGPWPDLRGAGTICLQFLGQEVKHLAVGKLRTEL